MLKPIRLIALLSILILMTACASLSKSECNTGDWSSIGSKDASKGFLADKRLERHRSACAKYQKTPNVEVYNSGYAQGLKLFCVNKVGFKHGSRGSEYFENCPATLEREFLNGYVSGLEVAMDNVEDDIEDLRFQRRKINRKLDALYYSKKKNKKHKKYIRKIESRLKRAKSEIYSKRDERRKLRSWHSVWLFKLNKTQKP